MKIKELIPSQNANADTTSVAFGIGDLKTYSVVVYFTGADVVGNLKIFVALEEGDEYIELTGSSHNVTASIKHLYNVDGAGYNFIKLVWDYTSGTGNISAKASYKENLIKGG